MNKRQLSEILAERAEIPKYRALKITTDVMNIITEALTQNERVVLSDFGVFYVGLSQGYSGYDPVHARPMNVPPQRRARFRVGQGLKRELNQGS